MVQNSTDIFQQLLLSINQSGGKIPLEITTTVSQSNSQFLFTAAIGLLSLFFVFMYAFNTAKPQIGRLIIRHKLKAMKAKTGRNILVIKHTMSDLFNMSMINQRTMMEITKALNKFDGQPFDLVLHTPGGEIFSSLFISRLLIDYPGKINVIVPYYAMSGGTLLALSGDEIYMSRTACLGPVDPQLGNLFKYGSAKTWSKIVKLKGKEAEDSSISFAFTGSQYTKSITRYIDYLLKDKMNKSQRKRFLDVLTSGDIEHAYPLTPGTLNSFGLKIKPLDSSITERLNKLIVSNLYEGVYYI